MRRNLLCRLRVWTIGLTLGCLAVSAGAAPAGPPGALTEDRKILQALNRLTFGPRPGDPTRVRALGLPRWIDRQLHPDSLPDEAVEEKLAGLKLLRCTPPQLHFIFASDIVAFLKAQGKGTDAVVEAIAGGGSPPDKTPPTPARTFILDVIRNYVGLVEKANIPPGTSVQAVGELSNAKLVRAVESNRQLQEVLVDFWSNHFNVDVKKGAIRTYKVADERDAIRPHVLGRFRDLLEASAKSPAMLTYLDNASSTRAPTASEAAGPDAPHGGLNENYARELMELHTLGVDGGYTQKDIQEVARCLTGWGINPLTGEFRFDPQAHDQGEKTVLGVSIAAGGGMADGERVLDILASHPSTARFIARKLCVRFVSDDPPPALVARVAHVFRQTGGDLRATVRAVITDPAFWTAAAYRSKIKSPFEFAVSAARALGGEMTVLDADNPLDRLRLIVDGNASTQDTDGGRAKGRTQSMPCQIAQMGQPLYSYQAPTGYPESSSAWVSSGALVARLNFALALTSSSVTGVSVSLHDLFSPLSGDDHSAVLHLLETRLIGEPLSSATRAVLKQQMPEGTPPDPQKLVALVLGSPEFQRR